MHRKLTEVEGKSSSSAERLRMVSWTHDKFMDLMVFPEDAQYVDGRSHGRTEC